MTLAPGARLGPYEVLAPLGAGGMGEVYKARDHRLDRLVAVKILPASSATSADAHERFEREARTISKLSHPHVCALFDVGREGDTSYLVMELLDGQTLKDLIATGPVALEELLRIGGQIADALAAAAREGIAHRDLKPGNVMLTRSGVKLLDFGLAKAVTAPGTAHELTTAADLTAPGMWLGTAPYMSPEQCEGKPIDARSDVFALGAVLYEMSTGRRPFTGDTPAAIASSILRLDPAPPSSLRPDLPAAFDRLVRDCLAKEPDRRWQSAHDVALQLAAIGDAGAAEAEARGEANRGVNKWFAGAAIVLVTALGTAGVMRLFGPSEVANPSIELEISPPQGTNFAADVESIRFALSPDGKRLAYIAYSPGVQSRVWIRTLSSIDAVAVPGTEGTTFVFWSPDGRSIAFVTGDSLKRLDLASGVAVTICKAPDRVSLYGTWSRKGEILFATTGSDTIFRVNTAGGDATALVKADPSKDEIRVAFPSFLPDGDHYLYLLRYADGATKLMLGELGKAPREVMPIESNAQFVEPGMLVYAKGGALVSQAFDVSTGKVSGEPMALAKSVRFFFTTSLADFSTAPNGTLIYQSHSDRSHLEWFDRSGRRLGTVGSAGNYLDVRLGPGQRTALTSRTLPSTGTYDIWSIDLERDTETRLTLDDVLTEIEGLVVPAGDAMVYAASRGGAPRLMRRNLRTGHDEPLSPAGRQMQGANDVSPDGKRLVFEERTAQGNYGLWMMPLTGPMAPSPIRLASHNETQLRFAPDGDHYVFVSDESGRPEVYLGRFSGGNKIMVSTNGGAGARWTRNGREIVYVSLDLRMMSVSVQTTPEVTLGRATTLFASETKHSETYDVTPDGERFLMVVPDVVASEQPLTAMINAISRK